MIYEILGCNSVDILLYLLLWMWSAARFQLYSRLVTELYKRYRNGVSEQLLSFKNPEIINEVHLHVSVHAYRQHKNLTR